MHSQQFRSFVMARAKPLNSDAGLEQHREGLELVVDLLPLPSDVTIEPADADGVPAEWINTPGMNANKVLLFLHGGGYSIGSLGRIGGWLRIWRAQAVCVAFRFRIGLRPSTCFPLPWRMPSRPIGGSFVPDCARQCRPRRRFRGGRTLPRIDAEVARRRRPVTRGGRVPIPVDGPRRERASVTKAASDPIQTARSARLCTALPWGSRCARASCLAAVRRSEAACRRYLFMSARRKSCWMIPRGLPRAQRMPASR